MKIRELYELFEGLKELAQKELPFKPAYSAQKNLVKVQSELKTVEEFRDKLIAKYKDEEKSKTAEQGTIILKGDKLQEFNTELSELMDQEVEIELKKIKIADLDGITVKPIVLNQIKYILAD